MELIATLGVVVWNIIHSLAHSSLSPDSLVGLSPLTTPQLGWDGCCVRALNVVVSDHSLPP